MLKDARRRRRRRAKTRAAKAACPRRATPAASAKHERHEHELNAIRASFLDFFARNDHAVMPSSPLVPRHDPTLMFTNAGMVQFKNVFTGARDARRIPASATAQKCVRAGGKHNDLDNVGYTARHHTFFEMLGNFSFGDYFKERAIVLAWELLTRDFALAKERLLITVFAEDEEAARLWRKIAGVPDEQDPPHRRRRQFLVHGRYWAPAGRARRSSTTMGRSIAGGPARQSGRRGRPLRRDLESRLHAI